MERMRTWIYIITIKKMRTIKRILLTCSLMIFITAYPVFALDNSEEIYSISEDISNTTPEPIQETIPELTQETTPEIIAEPTPDPEKPPDDPVSRNEIVSGNNIDLTITNDLLKEIINHVENIEHNTVSGNIPAVNANNDEAVYDVVSGNGIMDKSINDYDVSESLLLIIAVCIICAAIVYVVYKAIYRWK